MTLNIETESEVMEGVAFVQRAPKLMPILETVAAVYRVGKMDMMSLRRYPHVVEARDAFYWLSKHLTPRTYTEIGRFFMDRDHSTVWEGVNRAGERIDRHKLRMREVCKRLGVSLEELSK
jgi:chromosomal replication initiation ATPase DnaA